MSPAPAVRPAAIEPPAPPEPTAPARPARGARPGARSTRSRRAATCPGRAWGLAWALALLAACGPSEPEAPPRYAVAERLTQFELHDPGAAEQRFSRTFRPAVDDSWTFEDHSVQQVDGELLRAETRGPLTLAGPRDGGVNAALQHVLRLRVRAEGVGTLHLWWRKSHESWDASRSSAPIPFEFDGTWQTLQFGLASMHGKNDSDVSEGVSQFRVRFTPSQPHAEIRVELDEIALLSDFDLNPDALQLLKHHGTNAQGRVIPRDATLSTWIEPGPRDRLRFALAAGGDPVEVELRDADGRLEPLRARVDPADEWREFKLDLAPLGGRRTRLEWSVTGTRARPALAMLGAALRLEPEREPAPNLLLYLEDTLRADHLGAYGYAYETDPALSALAAEGVLMLRTFSASSWTRPSVSTLMSSLNPTRHGNRTHLNRLPEQARTLAEELGARGWVTRSFVTNYHGGQWAGLEQGFDLSADALAHGASHQEDTLTSQLVAGPLEDWLREHADERVFVHVHTLDPHAPYQAPPKLRAPFQRTRREREPFSGPTAEQHMTDAVNYDAEILYNDKRLARLDDLLGELGRRDDTLFVFLSDHGEAWQEHGQFEHRKTLHQEEVHVPWILRWPNGLPAGARHDEPVGLVDVAPTLLGLLGAPAPSDWQGRDLSAWLRGERASPPRASEPLLLDLVYERSEGDVIGQLAVVHGGLKLICTQLTGQRLEPLALYDLREDPGERSNLLDEPRHAEALAAMSAWAQATLDSDRAAGMDTTSAPMSDDQRQALEALGYLHGDDDG